MKQDARIIALLTDFSTKDYFVGAMKGAILSINRRAKIVDITHDVPPQDIASASFTLRACYKDFPEKTIFVSVVDPGVGSDRKAILVETEKYFFIAPDNGLLSFIFTASISPPLFTRGLPPTNFRVFELTNEKFFAARVSRTFHGRDIFAPAAAHLSCGVKPEEFGREIKDFVCFEESVPHKISETEIEAKIIHIDRFGNLITNIKREDLPEKFYLEINNHRIEKMQNFYAETGGAEIFMIFGSAGFLEISAFQDSASKILKVSDEQKITVRTLS